MFGAAGKFNRSRGTDPYWNNVSLLLHGDGANGSTTVIDSTGKNTLTCYGSAQISTAQSKFGVSSLAFDGSGDYISTAANSSLTMGSGDFTVEFFFYATTTANTYLFALAPTSNITDSYTSVISVGKSTTNNLQLILNGDAGWTSNNVWNSSAWNHIAIVRSGSTAKLFCNGVVVISVTNSTNFAHTYLHLGAGLNTSSLCNLDEFRITKGIARYTANFTPPSAPFLNS